ncbi:MAG: hypothetical protein A2W98_03335 [Bacteroidetes bacterium GWF2_33_38]|nr:MAG: hypothetical protein A2W98_03335 [Bacteroidetes bacterium GWF2_33_38]OFY91942.1 MAG: hypothetical protein A2236_02085 [Bacteroidetes bacterium RIFOXYA2_FULL_33_7]
MEEPILHYYTEYGFDESIVQEIVLGEVFSAVKLKNGNIGVCANMSNEMSLNIVDLRTPNLNNVCQRVVLNAYYNALLNTAPNYDTCGDIFDCVNFSKDKKIVMIGCFTPLVAKFENKGIHLDIFDLNERPEMNILPIEKQQDYLSKADIVIQTATTIANQTFTNIVNSVSKNCSIYLLGPSSILNDDMFEYPQIKAIFGSVFNKHDDNLLQQIKSGDGARKFLPLARKVSIIKK